MTSAEAYHVALIDDDHDVRDALASYLGLEGLRVAAFASADAFLASSDRYDVIVSDVRMPGVGGFELLRRIAEEGSVVPFILITGHGDVPMAVAAIKAGAADFIEKPFDEASLKTKIEEAARRHRDAEVARKEMDDFSSRLHELSPRQKEVLTLACSGASNKEIATQLGLSARTVEDYRAWGMQRVGVKNFAELVRLMARHELGRSGAFGSSGPKDRH